MFTVPEAAPDSRSLRLVEHVVREVPWTPGAPGPAGDVEALVGREWLVTNGIGGYSSASVAGFNTRKYHGVLVAALANPLGRMVMLGHLVERLVLADGTAFTLSGAEWAGDDAGGRVLEAEGTRHLAGFRLEAGLPVWTYTVGGVGAPAVALEKRLVMPHRQNTVVISYRLTNAAGRGAPPARLELRPALDFRGYEAELTTQTAEARYRLLVDGDQYVVDDADRPEVPPLRLAVVGAPATYHLDAERTRALLYRVEEARGYPDRGRLWSPGYFAVELAPDGEAALVASAEAAEVVRALAPEEAFAAELERRRRLLAAPGRALRDAMHHDARVAELVLAADQFLITPAGRLRDRVRAQAVGDEVRTVIAGYHWFTDWGRDTMIALEGLTLTTGRWREAGFIVRTFAQYVRDGLIPNMFPDGSNEGVYHTADATLWFFHAVDRYARVTGDRTTVRQLLPVLEGVARAHLAGTHYGIRVDPADGLLAQGAEGYQLTWMDAKMGDWVVTPRRGKAVEVNALWHNALCVLAHWVGEERDAEAAAPYAEAAARARDSFNRRFWHEAGQHLYDVVDGPDGDSAEFRPNQLLAISLPNPVLDGARWEPVVRACEERLVTPAGLRSLAPGSAGYRPRYAGDLRSRDGAYHQGTVWAWLIGPWVDAWRKVHPGDDAGARRWLGGLLDHLGDFGVGSVAEVFDAEAPFTPRGCVAQAWSVAEVLRVFAETAGPPGGAPAAA